MTICHHQNILAYYSSFLHDKQLWIVMPLISNGSLKDILEHYFPYGLYDEVLIVSILKYMIDALQYMDQKCMIHRDIKCENVLIHDDGQVVLSDLGISDFIKCGVKLNIFAGSPCWMAPEVIDHQSGYDNGADVWSLGVTAIEMAEGKAPHQNLNPVKVLAMIVNSNNPSLDQFNGKKWSK